MRLLHFYLLGYFLLVFGAGLALWQAGVVHRVPGLVLVTAAAVAVVPGVLLALTSTRPSPNRSE